MRHFGMLALCLTAVCAVQQLLAHLLHQPSLLLHLLLPPPRLLAQVLPHRHQVSMFDLLDLLLNDA